MLRALFLITMVVLPAAAQESYQSRRQRMSIDAETKGLAEPFVGLTRNGAPEKGLFPIRQTGVSTAPVKKAAEAFIATLSAEEKKKTLFAADDPEWRKWMNPHFYVRQGMMFGTMSEKQRKAATGLLKAGLSAKGLKLSQDIMHLNETLAELTNDHEQYGDGHYYVTVMGAPSMKEPWGFQLDGHHLVINYFILGDQVVMTPTFMGSEPNVATAGKYAGTRVLETEETAALTFVNSLPEAARAKAIIQVIKTGNNNLTEAWKDNVVLDYAGLPARELTAGQQKQLLDVVALYIGNMEAGHAKVRMEEVRAKLNDTYFAWIGGTAPDSVFYYRIHSPVILIEFDHQNPVAMPGVPRGIPQKAHVHTVVRTPNGNDYGKDLLRQHYADSHTP